MSGKGKQKKNSTEADLLPSSGKKEVGLRRRSPIADFDGEEVRP